MNLMLSDDDLTRLLGEAAESYPVPDAVLPEAPTAGRPRRVLQAAGVAAALVVGLVVVQSLGPIAAHRTTTAATESAPSSISSQSPYSAGGSLAYGTSQAAAPTAAALPSTPVPTPAKLPAAAVGSTSDAVGASQAAVTPDSGFADGARIVKTGSIDLVVVKGKVSPTEDAVRALATAVNGYTSNESSTEIGDNPQATMTLRVPVGQFETVLARVRLTVAGGVGVVESTTSSGRDITEQYADVAAQIQSLTASRNRFLTILGRADTIGETLEVQQRVDDTQEQIDRLTGQQKVLADQSSLATLAVSISEKPKKAIVATKHVESGLSRSWHLATHGFSTTIESLIARSGKGLVVLVVAVIVLLILRSGWRLARRRLV